MTKMTLMKELEGKSCNQHGGTYDVLGRCYDCMIEIEQQYCSNCETGECSGDLEVSNFCCYCNDNEFEHSCTPCQVRTCEKE